MSKNSKGLATRPLENEEYKQIMHLLKNGFKYTVDGKEKTFRPNMQIALILGLEANLGLRIGDILKLKLSDFKNNRIDIIGRITYKDEFTEVEILESKFKAIIEEGGFKDSRVLLKELKKQGLLDAEGDRHYRKRKLNTDIPVKVNVIRLPKK